MRYFYIFQIYILIASTNVWAEPVSLKLGAVLPLSGKGATVGISIRNGMTMAHESLPETVRSRLNIQFEDDGSETRMAVTAVQRLVAESKVDAVLTAFSNTGNAVVPVTERGKMPLISLAYDQKISDDRQYAFTLWPSVRDLAVAARAEAWRRGYRRIAIASSIHEGNLAMRAQFLEAGSEALEFPVMEELALSDTDFNTQSLRLRAADGLDAIATFMHAAHLGAFVKSMRSNGVTLPIFTLGNFEDQNVRAVAGSALRGQWYSAVTYSQPFLKAYREKFPQDSTFGAAFGYDAVLLLANALQQSIGKEGLPQFLRRAELHGGAVPEVVANGKNGFRFPVSIKIVGEDGLS